MYSVIAAFISNSFDACRLIVGTTIVGCDRDAVPASVVIEFDRSFSCINLRYCLHFNKCCCWRLVFFAFVLPQARHRTWSYISVSFCQISLTRSYRFGGGCRLDNNKGGIDFAIGRRHDCAVSDRVLYFKAVRLLNDINFVLFCRLLTNFTIVFVSFHTLWRSSRWLLIALNALMITYCNIIWTIKMYYDDINTLPESILW